MGLGILGGRQRLERPPAHDVLGHEVVRDVEVQALHRIAVAETTDAEVAQGREVVELLGAPQDVVQLAKRSAYRYDFTMEKTTGLFLLVLILRGVESRSDRVWLFFDEDDVLTHYGTTFQADEVIYEVPVFSSDD